MQFIYYNNKNILSFYYNIELLVKDKIEININSIKHYKT
jgi:hypothetical protein